MAILEEDKAAIRKVARLLTGDHHAADTKARILEAQMNEVASHCRGAGSGSLSFWIVSALTLSKTLKAFAEEQRDMKKLLGLN